MWFSITIYFSFRCGCLLACCLSAVYGYRITRYAYALTDLGFIVSFRRASRCLVVRLILFDFRICGRRIIVAAGTAAGQATAAAAIRLLLMRVQASGAGWLQGR